MSVSGQMGEARILLTGRCNYRCVFCHHEGMDPAACTEPDALRLKRVIDRLLAEGCGDITFTGGEPLMYPRLLMRLLRHIRACDAAVPVSIVTNGSLLEPDWVRDVARLGGIRFNISLHTVDPVLYCHVSGQNACSFDDLCGKLNLLKRCGIEFKLNAVALSSTISTAGDVAAIISFARRAGTVSLKIIELLIVEENQRLIGEYVRMETVEKLLPSDFGLNRKIARGSVFVSGNDGFCVELRKCRCHFGCETCRQPGQTQSFDASGRHWACFARPDLNSDRFDIDHTKAMAEGRKVIDRMCSQYGRGSPSLVRVADLISSKRVAWFLCREQSPWQPDGMRLLRHCRYTAVSFLPEGFSSDSQPLSQVHIRCNHDDPANAMLIISNISVECVSGLPLHKTSYLHPDRVPLVGSVEVLEATLNALGWRRDLQTECESKTYSAPDGGSLSTLRVHERVLVSVDVSSAAGRRRADALAARDGFQPVAIPLPDLLRRLSPGRP